MLPILHVSDFTGLLTSIVALTWCPLTIGESDDKLIFSGAENTIIIC